MKAARPGRRYAKCGLCGVWRPKREMEVHVVMQQLQAPWSISRGWECPSHTLSQMRRSKSRFHRWVAEVWGGG